jgi:hypothetical protein
MLEAAGEMSDRTILELSDKPMRLEKSGGSVSAVVDCTNRKK